MKGNVLCLKNGAGEIFPVYGWEAIGTTPDGDTIGKNEDGETFVFTGCCEVDVIKNE